MTEIIPALMQVARDLIVMGNHAEAEAFAKRAADRAAADANAARDAMHRAIGLAAEAGAIMDEARRRRGD
jgi:hypothetical protein